MVGDVAIVALAVLVGSFVKGVSGNGFRLVVVPFLAPFIGVESAVAAFAVPTVLTNAWQMKASGAGEAMIGTVLVVSLGGAIGVVGGTMILSSVDGDTLSLALAAVIGLYIAIRLLLPRFAVGPRARRYSSGPVGLVAGLLQGSTGVGGPVLIPYLHALQMPRSGYIFAVSLAYQIFGGVQLISLIAVGALTLRWFLIGLVAVGPILLGLWAGMRYGQRLSAKAFDRWVLVILALTGGRLVLGVVG